MKIVLIISAILFAITMRTQKQEKYDSIGRNDFYILKDISDLQTPQEKFQNISNIKNAEQQYGSNYKSERQFADAINMYYTKMTYNNGLTLEIPDNPDFSVGFHINSNQYILKLKDGTIIRVGMKVDELRTIFPKSFKQTTSPDNKETTTENPGFFVCFSSSINGKTIKEDAFIIFVINKKDGVLKEFRSWEPI